MPKEEWGTKRVCPTTGKRFYDLNKDPIVSPYTGEPVVLDAGKGKRSLVADKEDAASTIDEEEPDPAKPEDWIYYYDPNTDIIGKIPRQRALGENFIIRYDQDMKEHQDSAVKEWDGKEGKKELIWQLKDACKGKGKKSKAAK